MNLSVPLTNIRSYVGNEFSALRTRAVWDALWTKLIGGDSNLAKFPEGTFPDGLNRKSLGVRDIPVKEIVGTLYRHSDFDHQFRPLKKNLRDRWVNIYLLHEREGWPPIFVHKVGGRYYVEDGHHRVSVARSLGMVFIQAKVWEYPSHAKSAEKCVNIKFTERRPLKKYFTEVE